MAEIAPFPLKKTEQLEGDPTFRQRVDALASHERIESERVGFAGHPSEAHAAFRALIEEASEAQLQALLQHESPVVRGYVASWLARREAPPEALTRLWEDGTEVFTLLGCTGGRITVGEIARGQLEV